MNLSILVAHQSLCFHYRNTLDRLTSAQSEIESNINEGVGFNNDLVAVTFRNITRIGRLVGSLTVINEKTAQMLCDK